MKIMKRSFFLAIIALLFFALQANALLTIELTRWMNNAIPMAIVPFAGEPNNSQAPDNVAGVVNNDLKNSGRFKMLDNAKITQFPSTPQMIKDSDWRDKSVDYIVVGQVQPTAGRYHVNFSLVNLFATNPANRVVLSQDFTVKQDQLRGLSHHISDLIYQQLVGIRGIFSTRIAYVTVERPANQAPKYILRVADFDGYNPKPMLTSTQPIMSPAWSPDGRQLAYVSFENDHPQIFVQDVATGQRRLITTFPGINGAPAWSPDGKKLAVVLSKSGNPKIYSIALASGQLTQLTTGYSIDTEPGWSPDGQSIIFSSDRGGGLQIYQLNLASGQVQRLTYNGKYNARASYTPDGKNIVVMHSDDNNNFNIAIQDLQTGVMRMLNKAQLDDSPSVAPNGSMVLYASDEGRGIQLGVVSTDGHVKLDIPAGEGDVQAPAWSPFLG